MMHILTLLFVALSSANAKLVPVTYSDELCSCKGQVDDSVIEPEQARTAMEWWSIPAPETTSWVRLMEMNSDQIRKAKTSDEKVYAEADEKLKNRRFPETKIWKSVRENDTRKLRLFRHLEISRLDYLLSGDVAPLLKPLDGREVPKDCRKFAESLRSEPEIKKGYDLMYEAKCPTLKDPQECLAKAKSDAQGPFGLQRMKVHLLSFGWHNCLNHAWQDDDSQTLSQAKEETKRTIKNLKCECDEP